MIIQPVVRSVVHTIIQPVVRSVVHTVIQLACQVGTVACVLLQRGRKRKREESAGPSSEAEQGRSVSRSRARSQTRSQTRDQSGLRDQKVSVESVTWRQQGGGGGKEGG